ncbi:hypothetical protein ACGRHY_16050 [Streptomyces sp. HK10]|uniref:hypothetical protein n=1 Tax=Streptomyces sp. HK10 TaxID=3373255 RepID=UPI00374A4587
MADTRARRPPAHGAFADAHTVAFEFERDPAGGPLVVPPQSLDPFGDVGRGLGR